MIKLGSERYFRQNRKSVGQLWLSHAEAPSAQGLEYTASIREVRTRCKSLGSLFSMETGYNHVQTLSCDQRSRCAGGWGGLVAPPCLPSQCNLCFLTQLLTLTTP